MATNVVRTSLVLSKTLDRNLSTYCAIEAKSKTEVITEMLRKELEKNGFKTDQEPKITFSY